MAGAARTTIHYAFHQSPDFQIAVNLLLLRVVRAVIRADSDPARQALFSNLVGSHPLIAAAYRAHERIAGSVTSAVLVAGYGLVAYVSIAGPSDRQARVIAMAKHANAVREVRRVAAWIGSSCGFLRSGRRGMRPGAVLSALSLLRHPRRLLQVLRIVRSVDNRCGFLVACRSVAAMAWYARSRAILDAHRPGAVLVSSDSHPEEIAFTAAARGLTIPRIFVSHAYPTPLSPRLDFSLSILEGEAAVEARRRKGAIGGEVFLAGLDGDSAPLDPERLRRPEPVVGLFPPKAVSWPVLSAVVDQCRQHLHARQIVIRWHPSMLETPHLTRHLPDLTGIVESPASDSLEDVAQRCDWVIADENSNVHLPVMKLGIPTLAIRGLGVYPESRRDQYGFAANGVVFPPLTSLHQLEVDALVEFFSRDWLARFERFDAAYLRSPETVAAAGREAIARVCSFNQKAGPAL